LTIDFQVSGYANKLFITQDGVNDLNHLQQHDEGSSISRFQALANFLHSLLNCNDDGRIIVARQKPGGQPEDAYIKFVMLCAEKTFSEVTYPCSICCLDTRDILFHVSIHKSFLLQVTEDAHAVIMAGGTLQPIEETRLRLFPSLLPSDIKFFSCNHIVPAESILPIAVTRGPSGMTFDFSYGSRSSPTMVRIPHVIYPFPFATLVYNENSIILQCFLINTIYGIIDINRQILFGHIN
jgi:chromosome transmission fidelity protein 1